MNEIEKAQEKYEKFIKKFTTCDLLEYLSKVSIQDYQSHKKACTVLEVSRYIKLGITQKFIYCQWELVQISYNAIKYSNDYRGIKLDDTNFILLLNEHKKYDAKLENIKNMDVIKLFEHLQCMTNVQFQY